MPEFLERRLRQQARKKGFSGERADKYVYGAMNDMGAMHGSKETAKGREMEAKHEDDMAKGHNLREMRIEVHRDGKGKVSGHTVHHHLMPKPASKSGAFMSEDRESYPFGADGHSSTHGHMLDHIGSHLGMGEAEEEQAEEEIAPGIHKKVEAKLEKEA